MPAARRSAGLTLFWKIHRWIYAISGGRLGSNLMGIQIIRLTTVGRRSGQPRSVLLNAFPIKGEYVVVGSNAGADSHSLWFLNLQANPAVTVEISGTQFEAFARITHGEEREQLWADVVSADPSYDEYPRRTDRKIPVVVLERQSGDLEQTT